MNYKKKHSKTQRIFKKIISVILIILMLLPIFLISTPLKTSKMESTYMTIATADEVSLVFSTESPTQETQKSIETTIETSSTDKNTEPIEVKPTETQENDFIVYYDPTEVEIEPSTENVNMSNGSYLMDINNPDFTYTPQSISLSSNDRELAARVIMGEFGNGGYDACCLIAQCMRDGMIRNNCSVSELINIYQYSGYNPAPNQNCYDAIDYVFESGGLAVPHRILFMYATNMTYSSWHESQNFIIQYQNVRFFDAW